MSDRHGPAADGGAVDADGPASLLPGLELFVHSLLFGDDGSPGVGHLLESPMGGTFPIQLDLAAHFKFRYKLIVATLVAPSAANTGR